MSVGDHGCDHECPLCMEPLEMDDINFFPCTCGYQICRFCWHRIRTDENGLCPACRKEYPADPAEFKPLTDDELQRIRKERRQKDLQRKQKAAENRKHLANVRVVQKNLVFVVGLSQRLADTEVLKRNEYFGKFGKMHKVVINHSTSYAGTQVSRANQGPSASAYVTYYRPEDALRAIQAVNNIFVDGRTLKASLGTTKYCSHFLRGSSCPKGDCMYLHDLGEEAASFTKEQMQQGKHTEYEQRLYEMFMNSQNLPPGSGDPVSGQTRKPGEDGESPETIPDSSNGILGGRLSASPPCIPVEGWPSLGGQPSQVTPLLSMPLPPGHHRLTNGNKMGHPPPSSSPSSVSTSSSASSSPPPSKQDTQNAQNRAPGHHRNKEPEQSPQPHSKSKKARDRVSSSNPPSSTTTSTAPAVAPTVLHKPVMVPATQPLPTQPPPPPPRKPNTYTETQNNSMSLFSDSGFGGRNQKLPVMTLPETLHTAEIPETIPVSSTTDWSAAFGFTSNAEAAIPKPIPEPSLIPTTHIDDDLGFDPWNESTKALADMMEKEVSMPSIVPHLHHMPPLASQNFYANGFGHNLPNTQPKSLPPGFSPDHIGVYNGLQQPPNNGHNGSKMLGLMPFQPTMPMPPQPTMPMPPLHNHNFPPPPTDSNGHIPGMMPGLVPPPRPPQHIEPPPAPSQTQHGLGASDAFNMKDWQEGLRALLPNINISFQQSAPTPVPNHIQHTQHSKSSVNHCDEPPHWMASLQHLTEDTQLQNSRLPFLQQMSQMPFTVPGWAPPTSAPPPGFHTASSLRAPDPATHLQEVRQ